MDFNELIQCISSIKENVKVSGKEAAQGIKDFGKMIERFNQLSDKEKHQFLIDAFSNPEIKEDAKEFALRHPNCVYNKYISD
jgi:hypothetical protein